MTYTSIDADQLAIILEYAYAGINFGCINYRDPSCPLCAALFAAEAACNAETADYAARNWFTRRGLDRLRRRREIRKRGGRDNFDDPQVVLAQECEAVEKYEREHLRTTPLYHAKGNPDGETP